MATVKQTKAFSEVVKGSKINKAMKVAGYSDSTSKRTNKLTKTKGWQELMKTYIPDEDLIITHKTLLGASRLDNMTFPVYSEPKKEGKKEKLYEQLTDEDIVKLLEDVGCVVKKIVHSKMARYVYFWSPDNLAKDKALDKGYKLKGKYADEKKTITLKSKIKTIFEEIEQEDED